jgi:hypothetical protein
LRELLDELSAEENEDRSPVSYRNQQEDSPAQAASLLVRVTFVSRQLGSHSNTGNAKMSISGQTTIAAVLCCALAAAIFGNHAVAGKPAKAPKPTGGPRVIAYSGPNGLMTMDEWGGNAFTVGSDRDTDYYLARWSPDGLRLGGYEKRIGDGPYDIALMSIRADGTDERIVVSYAEVDAVNLANGKVSIYDAGLSPWTPVGFHGATWSPDGRFMVFGATVVFPFIRADGAIVFHETSCLYVADVSGVQPLRQLTDNPVFFWGDLSPHWSPTENIIVFQSRRREPDGSPHDGLWVVNPDGSGLTRIHIGGADLAGGYERPVWSHRRNPLTWHPQIVVHPANQPPMILDVDLDAEPPEAAIWTLPDIESGGYGYQVYPVWSPDDTRLLYSRRVFPPGARSYSEIAILDLLTSDERVLLHTSKPASTPDWSPVLPTP